MDTIPFALELLRAASHLLSELDPSGRRTVKAGKAAQRKKGVRCSIQLRFPLVRLSTSTVQSPNAHQSPPHSSPTHSTLEFELPQSRQQSPTPVSRIEEGEFESP